MQTTTSVSVVRFKMPRTLPWLREVLVVLTMKRTAIWPLTAAPLDSATRFQAVHLLPETVIAIALPKRV